MKKIIITIIGGLMALAMTHCTPKAGKAVSTTPSSTEVVKLTEAEMETGRMVMMNNCAKCHKLKMPETRTVDQWHKILNSMIPKAKLNAEDGKLVRAYIVANAKQG